MNNSIDRITLDVHKAMSQEVLYWKRGDTARTVEAVLMEHGKPYMIKDCTVVFTAPKANGLILFNDCEIKNNRIIYRATTGTTDTPGSLLCEFRVIGNNGKVLTAPRFTIKVEETVVDPNSEIADEPEVGILDALISETAELVDDIKEKLDNGEFKGEPFKYEDFTPEQLAALEGPPGKSAYSYAVDAGYPDSEEQFAADLAKGGGGSSDLPYITPQMFGAKGDGKTNDTEAINNAFESLTAGGKIYFPPGTYIVNHGGKTNSAAISASGKTNITVELDNAATIQHSPTNNDYYKILEFVNCNGIEIHGGSIIGDADDHVKDFSALSSFCIYAEHCKNVYIHDIVTKKCFGDGIGIFAGGSSVQCEGILIERCTVLDHIRNGIVFSGVKDGIIRNCHIYNIASGGVGCLPMAGIDLESHSSAKNENIIIEGCHIHDCGKFTIIHSSGTCGSFIKNCNLVGDVTESPKSEDMNLIDSTVRDVAVRHSVNIKGCEIQSISVYDNNGELGNTVMNVTDTLILGRVSGGGTVQSTNATIKATFKNCYIAHPEGAERPLFYFQIPGTADITLDCCDIHLWKTTAETFVTSNEVFDFIKMTGCTITAESEEIDKRIARLEAKEIVFAGNSVDMTKVTSYSPKIVISLKGKNEVFCSNNTFLSQSDKALCDNVFGGSNVTGSLYIVNNSAPSWDGITTFPTATDPEKVVFVRDNVVSTTKEKMESADGMNVITSLDGTDAFIVHDVPANIMRRLTWEKFRSLIKNFVESNAQISEITDPATEYVATLPELEGNAILALTSDFENYYKKSETYSKEEVNDRIPSIDLTEYATKQYVSDNAQQKGDYLVSSHNTSPNAHNDIRLLFTELKSRLEALADSDDTTLDQMSEIVAYIKANKSLIDSITTSKISVKDIVNNLVTNDVDKPLSAAQGVALKALIDSITVPTKLSELSGDSTHMLVTETEKSTWDAKSNFSGKYADLEGKPTIPTVPEWAQSETKPSYSKSEVGLGNVDNVRQYSASNPPPYPVTSVNGKTGAVSLDTITITGVDESGTTHTWTMYGVKS